MGNKRRPTRPSDVETVAGFLAGRTSTEVTRDELIKRERTVMSNADDWDDIEQKKVEKTSVEVWEEEGGTWREG